MSDRFEGKVALVTGASRGIGRAIAERLAREGARLVLGFHHNAQAMSETEAACLANGAEVVCHAGDIGDPGTAATLCDLAEARFGRLDVLVNDAGATLEGPLAVAGDDEVRRLLATNVAGVVWTTRAALRPMLRQRAGAVVNVSSVLAVQPGRGTAVYAGSKGFVESFTRATAVETAGKGIRVNAVRPGVVATGMTEGVRARAGEQLLGRIGIRRLGSAEEVAAAVAFLASDEASYVSGAVLAVDGVFLGGG